MSRGANDAVRFGSSLFLSPCVRVRVRVRVFVRACVIVRACVCVCVCVALSLLDGGIQV